MKKKNIVLGGVLGVLTLVTAGTASAHMGGDSAVRDALDSKDYAAFQIATEGKRIAEKITSQDQFNQMTKAHDLRGEGKHEEARAIMENLGFEKRGHRGEARNPEAREAVTNGDYAAFQSATEGKGIAEKIDSQEKFTKLVEANALRKAGDHDGAKAIMEELGLPHRGGHHNGDKK